MEIGPAGHDPVRVAQFDRLSLVLANVLLLGRFGLVDPDAVCRGFADDDELLSLIGPHLFAHQGQFTLRGTCQRHYPIVLPRAQLNWFISYQRDNIVETILHR